MSGASTPRPRRRATAAPPRPDADGAPDEVPAGRARARAALSGSAPAGDEDLTPGAGRSLELGYLIMKAVLRPLLAGWFKWHIEGGANLPPKGQPAIVAVNHISYLDPLAIGYAVDVERRRPRFLAKAELFKVPVVGWVIRSAKQIKVDRAGRFALRSLRYAEKALAEGEVVIIFPEGTTSTAPDLAPGRPKSGVARLALVTGAPVIPCATWGGQWVWTKHLGINPGPRKEVWVRFGPPMSFEAYSDRVDDPQAWREVTRLVMDEIAVVVAGLKAAKPWTARDAKPGRILTKSVKKRIAAAEADARAAGAQAPAAEAPAPASLEAPPGPGSPKSSPGPRRPGSRHRRG